MTTLTLNLPDKFKTIVGDQTKINLLTSYFVDDYLQEMYQDSITKIELEKDDYDKELNNQLRKALGI